MNKTSKHSELATTLIPWYMNVPATRNNLQIYTFKSSRWLTLRKLNKTTNIDIQNAICKMYNTTKQT